MVIILNLGCGIIYSINNSYYVFITGEGEEFIVHDDFYL